MPRRKDGEVTKEKILAAASRLFARKGYRGTTVAEIASESGVNGALVNYYYGEKAELYRSAWDFVLRKALERHPLYGKLNESAPAVKRLYEIIASDIARRSDTESSENDIMLNELSSPTGILENVHAKSFSGLRAALRAAVQDILGTNIPEEEQRLAVLSIFAMCVVPVKQIQQMEGNPEYAYDPEERARHVYNFAMAGLLDLLSRGAG